MKYPHICLLYDTRNLQGFAAQNFQRLQDAVAGLCQIRALCHRRQGGSEFGASSIVLNDPLVFGRFRKGTAGHRILPGNCDLKLIAAATLLHEFELFVRFEDDVYANDDAGCHLERLLDQMVNYDFAASYFEKKSEDRWMWWKTLAIPGRTAADADDLAWKAFLPIMSFNRRFLDRYLAALGDGWRGHYEVTMISVARFHQLDCLDISRGPLHFTSYPQFSVRAIAARQPSCPPFVHPIKNAGELGAYLGHASAREPSGPQAGSVHGHAFW